MKTTRFVRLLSGGVAAGALLSMAVTSPVASSADTTVTAAKGSTVSISAILSAGDGVTGVRGTTKGDVILTGSAATGNGAQAAPFLFQGPPTPASEGAPVSVLTPPFPGVTTATFYGPDTHRFNPHTIPAGKVRAVGSYQTSSPPRGVNPGVINLGMIYLGPVTGPGSWKSINVPAHGKRTVGHVRACPKARRGCFVLDTIPHSTMGDLVVGNYDLNPGVPGGLISGNAFIYNMTTRLWTLLQLGGSLSSATTLYGIWQDGGPGSPHYTLAGGSSEHGSSLGTQRGFLMNYNERTGVFGKPTFYTYGNVPALVTHFEGITAVPRGFNVVAQSSAQPSSMAFIPATGGDQPSFGTAKWYPIDVAASSLCTASCSFVSGDTVYRNRVMGLYVQAGTTTPNTYLAIVSTR